LRDDQARQRAALQTDDGELRDLEVEALIVEQTAQLRVAANQYVRCAAMGGILAETFCQQVETLEQTIEALQQPGAKLERKHAQQVLSDEEITTCAELAAWPAPRLEVADHDFALRRSLIEAFNWRFSLVWRETQRVVAIRWRD
jgi:hypothetical protein